MASTINSDNGVSSGSVGLKYASDNSGVLALQTNGNTAVTIDSTGLVTLPYGQIKFPATQNASSDANTLDDYEEGTWTPAFSFTTTNGSLTYDSVYGRYTKIGNIVNATLYLGVLSKGTASGDCRITLPFTSSSTTANYQCSSCWIGSATGTSGSYMVYTAPNEALARFQYSNTGAQSNLTSSNVQNATGFMVNITYQVA